MKKINCAVIGMGVGARHADFYNKYKYTNLVKIFEIDKKKWKNIKKRYPKAEIVNDENEIFNDTNINLVSLASYDNHHYSQILKAAKFKKNIFVEKPICLYLKELKKIKMNVEKNKINMSCNFVLRENKQFKKIKDIILKKKIGKIYYGEGDYNYGRIEKVEKGWRGKIPYYSVTHGGAIHMIDLILWYLNELPDSVISSGNRLVVKNKNFKSDDFTIGILKFKSRKIVKITSNFGCVMPHHHALKIFGDKGSVLHDIRGGILVNSRSKKKNYKKFHLNTTNKQKSNIIKCFVDDIINKRKKKLRDNFKSIINSMLVSLAIEKSIKVKNKVSINYKKLDFND
jgi:predicted dehydrogenase